MPILSVAQAARLAQVDRATIRRKINAGILSANTRPDGGKGIELSELLRVYPDAAAQVAPMSAHGQDDASAQGSPIAALERENELYGRSWPLPRSGKSGFRIRLIRFNNACYRHHARALLSGLPRRLLG